MKPHKDRWLVVLVDLLIAIIIILIVTVNPPPTPNDDEPPPGNLMVEIRWPDECRSDVDLWVKPPMQKPVGYSHQSGESFNLLRDDLGHQIDFGTLNYENSFSRGLLEGEYIVNVHLYKVMAPCKLPIPVRVKVALKSRFGKDNIHESIVHLGSEGHEITVVRFDLDSEGRYDKDSNNYIPIDIAPLGDIDTGGL